jgi:hypothetical protein
MNLKNEGPEREAQILRCSVEDPSGNQAVAENPKITIRAGSTAWFNYPKDFRGPGSVMTGVYHVVWESQADLLTPSVRVGDEMLDVTVTPRAQTVPETPIGSKDWQELAQNFGRVPTDMRADWWIADTKVQGPIQWQSLAGGPPAKHCEALCRLAGNMLLRSPKIAASLPDDVRSRAEPLYRWLDFLKARYSGIGNIMHLESERDDGTKVFSLAGQIEHVGTESVTACLNCAADET